ncbi:MAG TPA: sortase [Anaerolineales bacterium]|nr:sortase [Anaerolineales bacterium]
MRRLRTIRISLLAAMLLGSITLGPVTSVWAASLPAEINKQFTPLQIDAGGVSVLRITIFNPNTFQLTNAGFTDDLERVQPGLFIANPAGLVNTCGGTVAADPGSTSIVLSGGLVPAQVGATPGECYVEVNISSITAGNLINTIPAHNPASGDIGLTAQGVDGGSPVAITNTSPASATITVVGVEAPSLSKSFNPNTIFVGQTSQMTIRINNNDLDTNLTAVSFADNLPTGMILATPTASSLTGCGAGAALTAAAGGTLLSLENGMVTPATDCVIRVNVTGTSGIYTNQIPAGPVPPESLHTLQGVTNIDPVQANLNIQPVNISKAFSPLSIDAGDTATLTITLQNPTNTAYTNVGISDTLPTGLTYTGTPTTTCGSGVVTFPTTATLQMTGGTIPASSSPPTVAACTIIATVSADLTASGTLRNTIPQNTLTAAEPGVTNFVPVTADITVIQALTGTKSFVLPAASGIGGVNTISIQLANNSSTPLTGVTFTDDMPAGLDVSGTPASPQCGGVVTGTSTSITLTGGTIAANSSCTIQFNVTTTLPGTYENTIPAFAITTTQGVGNRGALTTGTDLTVVNASNLPVEVAKAFVPAAINPGQTSRLTITITAPLDIGINGISVTDTFPTGMSIAPVPNITETCPGGTVNTAGGDHITFTNLSTDPLLAAGVSCQVAVNVIADPGLYVNTIGINTISTNQGRTNELTAAQDDLSVTTMTMSKAFYPTTVQAEGRSTMTITLQNTSDVDLMNLSVTDLLPGNTVDGVVVYDPLTTVNTCGGSVTASVDFKTLQLTDGIVPAQVGGVPGICTITVDVQGKDSTAGTPSGYTNTIPVENVTATVDVSGPTIQPLAQAQATLNIKSLKIGVVKGFNPVLVYGGATSTMTVQLINPNNVILTGVAFTDNMSLISAGIQLAYPTVFNTGTCGGTLTGNPGDTSFSFSGGVIQPNSSCTLTLKVIMAVNGNRTNRIPAGAVITFNGVSSDQPTEASLTNLPGVSINKSFTPDTVSTGEISRLTISIRNTGSIEVVNMGLIDTFPTLPTGLEVASPANENNTCGGSLSYNAARTQIILAGGGLAAIGAPGDSCVVEVDVVAVSPGAYVNFIPSKTITSTGGVTNNNPATATLRVGALYSLGNRVWFDTNNNGVIDTTESGVDGVTVHLYSADAGGNPAILRASQVTSGGGYYRFDDLEQGDYVAVIPADNFKDIGAGDLISSDPLKGYWSSGTSINNSGVISDVTSNDPDDDVDSDENGLYQTGGAFDGAVISNAVTLGVDGFGVPNEPTDDDDMPIANPFGESPDRQSNRTVDFGFYRASLGNLIYLDSNANGTYDGVDSPISGALVELFVRNGGTDTEILTGPDGLIGTSDDTLDMTTSGTGSYLFSGLPEGVYVVKVTPSAGGYISTVDTASAADTANPDMNINNNDNGVGSGSGQVSSNSVTLEAGNGGAASNNTVTDATGTTYDPTLDFGFLLYGLGNRVWYDTNTNSVLDASESGISGVRVELYQDSDGSGSYNAGDASLGFDTTDTNGYYRFDDLTAGDYLVMIPGSQFASGAVLAGYWSTGVSVTGAGTLNESATNDPDNDADSNADENGISTFAGSIATANPVSYVASAAVTLGGATPEPIGETAPNGQGTADDRANMTVDFGFYRVSLGDLVFVDLTDDGDYDTGMDTPLNGAVVQLFTSTGVEVPAGTDGMLGTSPDAVGGVTTVASGLYSFGGLPTGDYVVQVTPPAGYSSTVDISDAADTADPDVNTNNNDNGIGVGAGVVLSNLLTMNPATDSGANITVTNTSGTTADSSVDFGFVSPYYSLGNRVWYDTNNNGVLDVGENGINAVLLTLYRDTNPNGVYDAGDGAALGTATTDTTGYYRFDNLSAGDYVVVISNDNFTSGGAASALVNYWSSGTSIAANGVIGEAATNDPDNDSDNSLDENGLTTFAGSAISYVSSYAVTLDLNAEPINEADVSSTWQGASDNRANMTVDFGFYRTVIGNFIFVDTNGNGFYSAAEADAALSGAIVQLYSEDGSTLLRSATTVAAGTYSFSVPEGNYIVKVTPPVGYSSTIDTNNVGDSADPDVNFNNNDNGIGVVPGQVPSSSGLLTMDAGEFGASATGITTDNSLDFGFTALRFSVGNRVWFDTDNDSLIDAGEIGVAGVRVELFRDTNSSGSYDVGDAYLSFDDTDTNGYYRFDNLLAGNYIALLPEDNFRNVGAGDAVIADPLSGYWSSGTSIATAGAITDATANDPDADVDDLDDNGRSVFLATGSVDYISASAITLGPGLVEPTIDNDPATNPEVGEAANDQSNRTVDFGFYHVAIGDLTFLDAEPFDGLYTSPADSPVGGLTVRLFAGNGATELITGADGVFGTADDGNGPNGVQGDLDDGLGGLLTNGSGQYQFGGLPAGDYVVKVTPLAGMASTVDTFNANDTADPDYFVEDNDNGSGTAVGQVGSGVLTMTPGGGTIPSGGTKSVSVNNSTGTTTDTRVDFGFNALTFSLGNRVWYDTDNDSILDVDESGISGVRVELYLDDGTVAGQYDAGDTPAGSIFQSTDVNGFYRFDGLGPGDYVVLIPADNFRNVGAGDTVASDLLSGYWSSDTSRADDSGISEGITPDPDNDLDSPTDENGSTTFTGLAIDYVASQSVTLGPATSEPVGETNLSASGQGTLDDRANMTVDFGFYQTRIGDLVFVDAVLDGLYGAVDALLSDAEVGLYSGDGFTLLASVTTASDGLYAFNGQPEGNYVLKVTPPNGYVSTMDRGTTANPDNNTDQDDNGITADIPGQVSSGSLSMNAGEKGANAFGLTTDLTVDFGFKSVYSVGNRIWFDTNNNGVFDAAEVGIENVRVDLYRDTNSDNVYSTGDAFINSTSADANGYYRFDNLAPGNYVLVLPSDNFSVGGGTDALVGYWSTGVSINNTGVLAETTPNDPDNDQDSALDENGTTTFTGALTSTNPVSFVASAAIQLGPGMSEPTGDSDPLPNPETGEAVNNQSNRTVDFGFYRVAVSDQIFVDLNEDDLYDPALDLPLPFATVEIFTGNGAKVHIGADGIFGTGDDMAGDYVTDATGLYTFTGLPKGRYVLAITPPSGYTSTGDSLDTSNPVANVDNNDNGVGEGTGQVFSNAVNLYPEISTGNRTVDQAIGATTDFTMDFGFVLSLAKAIVSTDAAHTADPEVTIGEIVTYQIDMLVPVGTLADVTLIDVPQTGLAFVDCLDIDLPVGISSSAIAAGDCSANDGATVGVNNPLIENNGGLITFDLGDVTNASSSPQIVRLRYSLIVLDVTFNQNGDSRTNNVTWTWDSGVKTVSADPVLIIEPELVIDKSVETTTASYGTRIAFQIEISHSSLSTADAFDVVVTDEIPAGLEFVDGSVVITGTASSSPPDYDPATQTLTLRWDEFPLGASSMITFDAIFVGPAPVTNSASVEWTSLLIDPSIDNTPPIPDIPEQLSDYNPDATERWYDPSAPIGVNDYSLKDEVILNAPPVPGSGGGGANVGARQLPATGFAPNIVTTLPEQPKNKSYTSTEVWLEIPSLGIRIPILGVPLVDGGWDVSWLSRQTGWLDGTAYPGSSGNSALTGHVTLSNGQPGPFAALSKLSWGDQVIIHVYGLQYVYAVRENRMVSSENTSVLGREDTAWLTLLTCNSYDENKSTYTSRVVVKAVLVNIQKETTSLSTRKIR